MRIKEIWIEAENWSEGQWNFENDNTDVIVRLENGDEYVASFFTYRNISDLTKKNKETGELLSGKYLWSSDMILIDRCSREDIEQVIEDLISSSELEDVFTKVDKSGM
ncbi:MAG TPA: hypothetical protein DCE41_01985 [Cytophagales bacterium]|nr:hypothetical protein [Cytophagales bacterium]HAA18896.1 hypothetical protein [Cytophagales bacterium]HAP61981.1 hypothetical protein [Cytophagales bacterium]